MAYLIERSNAFEAAFESNARNGKVGILKHRKRLMYAVKVKHFFEAHIHISVEGAREILIIISLFLRDIFKRNVVFEVVVVVLNCFQKIFRTFIRLQFCQK